MTEASAEPAAAEVARLTKRVKRLTRDLETTENRRAITYRAMAELMAAKEPPNWRLNVAAWSASQWDSSRTQRVTPKTEAWGVTLEWSEGDERQTSRRLNLDWDDIPRYLEWLARQYREHVEEQEQQ